MTKFQRNSSNTYKVITPFTPLDELEVFLKKNLFAIGVFGMIFWWSRAINSCREFLLSAVTDYERKFVLAVATLQDLEVRVCSTTWWLFDHIDSNQLLMWITSTLELCITERRLGICTCHIRLPACHHFGFYLDQRFAHFLLQFLQLNRSPVFLTLHMLFDDLRTSVNALSPNLGSV